MDVTSGYNAAGGNRHSSAADWTPGLLAFGAGNNIAFWNPDADGQHGVHALLSGHADLVNAVHFYRADGKRTLLTGGSDKTIRIWREDLANSDQPFIETECLTSHEGSVNTLSSLPEHGLFVSGGADGTVKVWSLIGGAVKLVQSITLKPRFLPLATALATLGDGASVLAVAGTSSSLQLYVRQGSDQAFELQATLTGHEGWIRSLSFAQERRNDSTSDLLLASASQDKYIRLWRFHDAGRQQTKSSTDATLAPAKPSLSNKAHQVHTGTSTHDVTFEALLIGHEDWIYTARWLPRTESRQPLALLSASADNSLAVWTADEASGVWICNARLGEISAQKGSTTATGSTGGFWTGLWRPDGQAVVSLGRTGSWRRWNFDSTHDMWVQTIGISGHTLDVQSCAWAPDGSYLLTTSADQTTRMFAEWKRQRDGKEEQCSWHEMARPQIHGYDLNCLDTVTTNQFISGADEKLLRVFNKPRAIANLLSQLSGTAYIEGVDDAQLPDAADIPVLGLSNKAIAPSNDNDDNEDSKDDTNGHIDSNGGETSSATKPHLDITHPPFEDHLARHTLWPEHEKLYGHGYEISAVASNPSGLLVATACKASSLDHAVIRLYETREWREVKPVLTAHSLTVTGMAFSGDGRCLLSVGRDRQWVVFEQGGEAGEWQVRARNPKGHARMILDCSWAPELGVEEGRKVFATAGRDKAVKIWRLTDGEAEAVCVTSISAPVAVTAVAFALGHDAGDGLQVAYGLDDGGIEIATLNIKSLQVVGSSRVPVALCPSRTVNALRWRPGARLEEDADTEEKSRSQQLAAVSDDTSVRIYNVDVKS